MLAEITITNLAIIDKLHLKFVPGFNVLTGETGAGKSIILDALGLLLGGRAQNELIRAGSEETRVEGIFTLNPITRELLAAQLEENGIALEDDSLILARELHRGTAHASRRSVDQHAHARPDVPAVTEERQRRHGAVAEGRGIRP